MTHEIILGSTEFYQFWQDHKTALIVLNDKPYTRWDTLMIKCDETKWTHMHIYKKISFIEPLSGLQILLHLKT